MKKHTFNKQLAYIHTALKQHQPLPGPDGIYTYDTYFSMCACGLVIFKSIDGHYNRVHPERIIGYLAGPHAGPEMDYVAEYYKLHEEYISTLSIT